MYHLPPDITAVSPRYQAIKFQVVTFKQSELLRHRISINLVMSHVYYLMVAPTRREKY